MTNIALIGCTGSIGRQTADIVRRYPDRFRFTALACGTQAGELAALCEEFAPRRALCEAPFTPPQGVRRAHTKEELFEDCDVALIAAGGFAGLSYTLAAIAAGKRVALANKESLVCGGELVMRAAKESGVEIVPVDSEHSAIFQCLAYRRDAAFEKLDETEKRIVMYRYYEYLTQNKTAELMNMTQVQVSRAEKKILLKLRELIK